MRVLLDLFAGELGWGKGFLAKGWKVVAMDLKEPKHIPDGVEFVRVDVLELRAIERRVFVPAQIYGALQSWKPDAICASSPCEGFAVWGMKHFHPDPPWPHLAITLFNHTRSLCEETKLPYIMENVRAAQRFVGQANAHAGSFHLWGTMIPPILPQRLTKGATQMRRDGRFRRRGGVDERMYRAKDVRASELATIPLELSACVADYAERILEQKAVSA